MAKKRKKKEVKQVKWLNFETAILLLLILAIFVIVKTALTPKSNLEKEAEIVLSTLTDGSVKLVEQNQLMEEKIRDLNNMDYDEIKNLIGVKGDFCIYFEDATGNIVTIDGIDPGIGSDKIYVNGRPCR